MSQNGARQLVYKKRKCRAEPKSCPEEILSQEMRKALHLIKSRIQEKTMQSLRVYGNVARLPCSNNRSLFLLQPHTGLTHLPSTDDSLFPPSHPASYTINTRISKNQIRKSDSPGQTHLQSQMTTTMQTHRRSFQSAKEGWCTCLPYIDSCRYTNLA